MTSESEEVERWSLPAKLRNELELALAGRLATSPELDKALAGDIGAVEFIWRSIADGTANLAERDIWVEAIAKRVIRDVIPTPARSRPEAANRAIGFTTFLDPYWRARDAADTFERFEALDGKVAVSRGEFADLLVARGYFDAPLPIDPDEKTFQSQLDEKRSTRRRQLEKAEQRRKAMRVLDRLRSEARIRIEEEERIRAEKAKKEGQKTIP